ncbi:MAG: ABC transporter ATP-binding protein [Planctomycetota bacterium]
MHVIEATNLSKTYRLGKVDVPVLRGASLAVGPGEWVAVLGASGSGKSTLLHLLGGLDRPDRTGDGQASSIVVQTDEAAAPVEVGSLAPAALDRYRRDTVGFVFQFYHLLPELTVLENTLLGSIIGKGRLSGLGDERQRASALLESFGLSHRLRHRPSMLSGGERQRVAVARALMNDPPIVLADEPTGNLDRATGESLLDSLESVRGSGRTLVMVTHDERVAARADRVVTMYDGQVKAAPPVEARSGRAG